MSDNGETAPIEKAVDPAAVRRSVRSQPEGEQSPGAFTLYIASVADEFPAWGRQPRQRDKLLRQFWPTCSFLPEAIYSVAIRNAAMDWYVDGPPRTANAVQDMLLTVDDGKGWEQFIVKVMLDLLTQDNGAFVEIVRRRNSPNAPVMTLNHLDAGQCRRTGLVDFPVVYTDRDGVDHKLAWYQVIVLAEFPSPVETMIGMQLCAVSRVLRASQILRDISIYKREKIGGRHHKAIHFVGGAKRTEIEDARVRLAENADNSGLIRYIEPIIVAGLDPERPVSVATIDLAALPDGYDEDVTLRWYIAELALGLGADYQDLAPLPGGGIGSSNQSEILHRKSSGKGPAFFRKMFTHPFNFHGILPQVCSFAFDEQDTAADLETATLRKTRAETYKMNIESGVLTPEIARQMMADDGDLTPEMLTLLGDRDLTPDVTVTDEAREDGGDVTPALVVETPGGIAAKFFRRIRKALRRSGAREFTSATNDYQRQLAEYAEAWIDDVLEADSVDETDAATARFAALLTLYMANELRRAYRDGLAGDPPDEHALAEIVNRNAGYVQNYITDARLAAARIVGLGTDEARDTLAGFVSRLATYSGAYWAAAWAGVGAATRNAGRTVTRVLSATAKHCEDCPGFAGTYESWDAMLRYVGGLPGDSSSACGGNCRCWIEIG